MWVCTARSPLPSVVSVACISLLLSDSERTSQSLSASASHLLTDEQLAPPSRHCPEGKGKRNREYGGAGEADRCCGSPQGVLLLGLLFLGCWAWNSWMSLLCTCSLAPWEFQGSQ